MNIKIGDFSRRQKIVALLIAAFFVFDVFFLSIRFFVPGTSCVKLQFQENCFPSKKLQGLEKNAKNGKIPSKKYAWFAFSDEQKKNFADFYKNFGTLSVVARVKIKSISQKKYNKIMQNEQIFYYGFVYPSDFDKKGKLVKSESSRIFCGTDLRSFLKPRVPSSFIDVGFAVEKNLKKEELPCGLVLYSDFSLEVERFEVSQAKIGFDKSSFIPYFGLASNGGSFSNVSYVDFSGASLVFPVENSASSVMPQIQFSFTEIEDYGSPENQSSVIVNAGGEKITMRRAKNVSSITIQTSSLNNPFSFFEISTNPQMVTKILMVSNSKDLLPNEVGNVFKALKTDPGLILDTKKSFWRSKDYEVYEWDRFPGCLIFDTVDYNVQSQFFTRVAFFAEKTGYKGRVLSDSELGNMHGYNAHDYSAKSLADFYTKAFENPSVLNKKELLLLDILIENGVVLDNGDKTFSAGKGAVISISKESQNWLRHSFIAHEAWHGIFFLNEDFRNAVAAVYYTIDSKSLDFIKGYWASQHSLNYDQNDEYLMHNEFMAYIMQQKLYGSGGVASYFVHVANRKSVMDAIPELCEYVRATKGYTFEDAGKILDDYAFDNWGLACGRISLVSR